MRPLVKICGLCRAEDARLAVQLGASHVGCVLALGSPRSVTPIEASRIFEAAGERATRVLVIKDETAELICRVAREVGVTHVQIYGVPESVACHLEEEGLVVYRVHSIDPSARALPTLIPEPSPERPAVLDVGGGGSGRRFSWNILGERAPHATFIAGGVRPENIGALLRYRPYGVDLSSGVESEPGVKDPDRLRRFFENLEQA